MVEVDHQQGTVLAAAPARRTRFFQAVEQQTTVGQPGQRIVQRGMPGFVATQGHIPSGVPYVGHALEAFRAGTLRRAMIIGKGSLFLGRLTNLADGASFLVEGPSGGAAGSSVSRDDVKAMLLEALGEIAADLQKA